MEEQSSSKLSTGSIAKRVALSVVWAALWVFFVRELAVSIELRDYIYWIAPAILIIGLVPAAALAAIGLKRKIYMTIALALSFVHLIFFSVSVVAIVTVPLFFIGFWRVFERTRFEVSNHVKFPVSQIIKRSASALLLVVLLVVSVYVYTATSQELRQNPEAFYSRISRLVTKGALPIVERQLNDFNPSETIDEFIVSGFAESDPEFRQLAEADRQELITESRQRITDQLGISASGHEPLSDLTQRAIEARVSELLSTSYDWMVPIIYTLAIFSLLWVLRIFGVLVIQAWGLFFFWLLRKSDFLHVTTTQIAAEHVDI